MTICNDKRRFLLAFYDLFTRSLTHTPQRPTSPRNHNYTHIHTYTHTKTERHARRQLDFKLWRARPTAAGSQSLTPTHSIALLAPNCACLALAGALHNAHATSLPLHLSVSLSLSLLLSFVYCHMLVVSLTSKAGLARPGLGVLKCSSCCSAYSQNGTPLNVCVRVCVWACVCIKCMSHKNGNV